MTFLYNLVFVSTGKALAFGQMSAFAGAEEPKNFVEFMTVPTFELEGTILRSGLKEQSDSALHANGLRYLDKHLRKFLCLTIKAHQLLWPTVLYVLTFSVILKVAQFVKRKFTHKVYPADHQPILTPEKSENLKKTDLIISRPKGFSIVWRIYCVVLCILLGFEYIYLLIYMSSISIRYTFLEGMSECVMDGFQNVTQLRNETYLNDVRTYCAKYGLPPNYGYIRKVRPSLLIRWELRNQTFLESVDYFWGNEREVFNFRISCFLLVQLFVFYQVGL